MYYLLEVFNNSLDYLKCIFVYILCCGNLDIIDERFSSWSRYIFSCIQHSNFMFNNKRKWSVEIKSGFRVMVFNPTFNNIFIISCRSVLLVGVTRVPGEKHQPDASHWQTLSHNVVSNTPRRERDSRK
jgi:hypothetical protein